MVVRAAYRVSQGSLTLCEEPAPLPSDPPDLSHHALWAGTSVTVAGDVLGPRSAPFQRLVSLAVGSVTTRLWTFGDRVWSRDASGALRASTPAPFERLSLSFSRAYGGFFDVPPGLYPGTDLPFPGGRFGYALNEGGIGFYADEAAAVGRPLPNFELADHLVQQWSDRPIPGCFVPCPELAALRVVAAPGAVSSDERETLTREGMLARMLRGFHHAPGYLIFDDVAPGTPMSVDGIGREAMSFRAPPPPARVRLRRGKHTDDVRAELRSIHVDADDSVIHCVVGHFFTYEDGHEPSWIVVEA
ncbi:Hypothetical protein A7982_12986 [Minicystis rosea]|nr:Hypothetical protein A7982_12986 [Minicystis rosea]